MQLISSYKRTISLLFSRIVFGGAFFALLNLVTGCSAGGLVVETTVRMMAKGKAAFENEKDLVLAEQAIAANLKLIESFYYQAPGNKKINLFLAEGYATYSLAFVEDKFEEYEFTDSALASYHKERARGFYQRAKGYASNVLFPLLGVKSDLELEQMNPDQLKAKLDKISEKSIGALFWYGFSWGSEINLERNSFSALANLPLVELMIAKVKEWDESYYYAGAWLFEAIYYGDRSATLGGDPERSKNAFEKVITLTEGKLLLPYYYKAKTYCIQIQDYRCFSDNLRYIFNAPDDLHPEQELINQVVKQKARRLAGNAEEYFLEIDESDLLDMADGL